MAGTGDGEGFEEAGESDCSFVWDEASNLYFHASSGFYHDPKAGWYYSSRDGHYYAFENGAYVLLTFNKDEESEPQECPSLSRSEPVEDEKHNEECFTGGDLGNQLPPSEWLEETLINLYLSGHSNMEVSAVNSTTLQCTEEERNQVFCEGLDDQFALDKLPSSHQVEQLEEECIPEDVQDAEMLMDIPSGKVVWAREHNEACNNLQPLDGLKSRLHLIMKEEDFLFMEKKLDPPYMLMLHGVIIYSDAFLDEEKWQAQYGQVIQAADEAAPHFPVIDLWDWEIVVGSGIKRDKVTRLCGRLVRRSSKLHPSVPSGGGLLKTASIRDVHLDLVRVASGKVYRLRTPNKRCLASLSAYDSSNPTKDWGFPDFVVHMHNNELVSFNRTCGTNSPSAVTREKSSASQVVAPAYQPQHSLPYRDRAAERRTLHGEFSIGPGQKNFQDSNLYEEGTTSQTSDPEEAAAEAMNMTFGKGSYARRVLENMGWKDGEALGSTTKGILEPLQVVANKGYAGLGWNYIR